MIACMSGPAKTDLYPTPLDFFRKMDRRYGPFDLDVCAACTKMRNAPGFSRQSRTACNSAGGPLLVQPALRQDNRPMGAEGVGIEPRGCYRGHAGSRPHRYEMVA